MPPEDDQKTPEQIAEDAANTIAATEANRIAEEEKNLNDAGKAALKAERDARKAAAKEAAEAKAELETLRKEKTDAAAAKAAADEDEAKRKGEFEQLANKRSEELQAAAAERDAYKGQLETLIVTIKPEVDTQWSALPAEVQELYEGAEDDVLGKKAHMAKHRKLIARLSEQQELAKDRHRTPLTPKPNGKKADEFTPVAPVRF